MRNLIKWGALIFILVVPATVYWKYYNTYSEGNRSGILQKFSKKGNVFKTYEGELILSGISSTNNVTIASEKFFFSVKDDSISKVLFTLEGKKVTVHYVQKRDHLPWNGETDYFVDGIISSE